MPIDASIPLSFRPTVAPENYSDVAQKVQSLKNMQATNQRQSDQAEQQRQLAPLVYQQQQAQTSEAQIRAQQMQQQQKNQQIIQDAYGAANGDPIVWRQTAIKNGATPDAISGLIDQPITAQKQAIAKMDAETLKTNENRWDAARGRMMAYGDQSLEAKKSKWTNFLDNLHGDKLSTDDEHLATLKQYPEYPGDEVFKSLTNQHTTGVQLMKERTAADAAASTAALRNSTIEKNKQATDKAKEQEIVGQLSSPSLTLDQWNQIHNDNEIPAGKYPYPFDQDEKPIPAKLAEINRRGMNAQQRTQEDEADKRAKELQDDRKFHQGIASADLKIKQDKANRETATEAKANVQNLAMDDLTRCREGGVKTINEAIADVNNPNLYKGHPLDKLRGPVSKALEDLKTQHANQEGTDARTGRTKEQIERERRRAELEDTFNLTGSGSPQQPSRPVATPSTPAKPIAPPAPAAKPASAPAPASGPAIVKGTRANGPGGHIIVYDGQQWLDEKTKKPISQ